MITQQQNRNPGFTERLLDFVVKLIANRNILHVEPDNLRDTGNGLQDRRQFVQILFVLTAVTDKNLSFHHG